MALQRTGYKLKRNHCNHLPRYIIAYDTETIPRPNGNNGKLFTHSFRLGVAICCRLRGDKLEQIKLYRLASPEDFWNLVTRYSGPCHTTWIVSHNALFDMVASKLPDQFEQSELIIDWPRSKRQREDNNPDNVHCSTLAVIESPPTIIACRVVAKQGRIVIVDTLNWFPVSLSTLGAAINLDKLPMPTFDADDEEWYQYCERDTEIVFHTFTQLIKWVKDADMGMFRYTGPAQAMSAYRHRFMECGIYFHDNRFAKRIERQSYFGGRTEVFRIGDFNEKVYQLDINSLFPSIMHAGLFPAYLDKFEQRVEWLQLPPDICWSKSIAEVEIITDQPIFPVRKDKRVLYPIGKFRTTLAGEELEFAARNRMIHRIRSWTEYRVAPLFKLWVGSLWQMRQDYKAAGNSLYEQFAKRLMNSLYGKFGQRSPKWVNVPGELAAVPWSSWVKINVVTGEREEYRSFGWQTQRRQEYPPPKCLYLEPSEQNDSSEDDDDGEITNSFPAISSFVTAAARMRMNFLRNLAGARNVFYQGVDGLIVNETGFNLLFDTGEVQPDALGKLRLETTVQSGCIYAAADYRLADKVVISGRANNAETSDNGECMQRKFSAASKLFTAGSDHSITEEVQPWMRSGLYAKGRIQPDGWVKPIELDGKEILTPMEKYYANGY